MFVEAVLCGSPGGNSSQVVLVVTGVSEYAFAHFTFFFQILKT